MINKFICVRLNSFYDKKYSVRLYDTHIELSRNGAVMNCQLSLDEQIYWFVQNRQLQGFGIKSKNKIKFFKATSDDLTKLRNGIRNKIMFQNIVDFYTILNVIKQSQEDSIFKVEDKLTQTTYALKMFHNKKKFVEEIGILKNFNNPNIVQIRECFKGDNYYYYVMEYLHGHSLKTILKITDRMTHLESKQIMNQILTALVEVQSQGIVLRNLRPDSFIFSQKNKLEGLKLIDFSYATRLDLQSSFEIQLPGYMAPEVLKKQKATQNSDIFSCGAIMFKLYTSQDLFDFNNNFEEAYHENMSGKINLEPLHIHNTPKQAMELIELMLKQQISAKDALNHDYFTTSLSPNERKKRFQKIIQANTERSLSTQLDDEKDDANTARIPTLIINKMLK